MIKMIGQDGWSRWSYIVKDLGLIYGRNWLISDIGCTLTDFLILDVHLDVINTLIPLMCNGPKPCWKISFALLLLIFLASGHMFL